MNRFLTTAISLSFWSSMLNNAACTHDKMNHCCLRNVATIDSKFVITKTKTIYFTSTDLVCKELKAFLFSYGSNCNKYVNKFTV